MTPSSAVLISGVKGQIDHFFCILPHEMSIILFQLLHRSICKMSFIFFENRNFFTGWKYSVIRTLSKAEKMKRINLKKTKSPVFGGDTSANGDPPLLYLFIPDIGSTSAKQKGSCKNHDQQCSFFQIDSFHFFMRTETHSRFWTP